MSTTHSKSNSTTGSVSIPPPQGSTERTNYGKLTPADVEDIQRYFDAHPSAIMVPESQIIAWLNQERR